jgi:endonuclease YncB( thermonuclease family)
VQAGYRGTVSDITNGNTLTVKLENKKLSIRLLGVRVTGMGQILSKEARENLVRMLRNKTVEVMMVAAEQPSQGMPESPVPAKVTLEGRDVGLEQIRGGFAFANADDAKYQTEEDRQLYAKAGHTADVEKRGLWSDKHKCKGDSSLREITAPPASQTNDAIKEKVSGMVRVQVTIDEDGKVISAKALCGIPLLREAAENAALGAKFSRTLMSGIPVKVTGVINYNFVAQ